MATAEKKTPAKRAAKAPKKAVPKKAAAKKSPARKTTGSRKKPTKGSVFKNALNDARGQMDEFVDSVKLKAKHIAAKEKLMQKKAELAAKAEMDKARHLAEQAEKWMRARIKSDTKKINALEKKLARQLHKAERKLATQARAAEKDAKKHGRALRKKLESETKKVFGKTPTKAKSRAKK